MSFEGRVGSLKCTWENKSLHSEAQLLHLNCISRVLCILITSDEPSYRLARPDKWQYQEGHKEQFTERPLEIEIHEWILFSSSIQILTYF